MAEPTFPSRGDTKDMFWFGLSRTGWLEYTISRVYYAHKKIEYVHFHRKLNLQVNYISHEDKEKQIERNKEKKKICGGRLLGCLGLQIVNKICLVLYLVLIVYF